MQPGGRGGQGGRGEARRGRRRRKKFIKCANINARSLGGKKVNLIGKVSELDPDIKVVTETSGKSNETYDLKEYTQYRNYRSDGYGGTILYVKKEIE